MKFDLRQLRFVPRRADDMDLSEIHWRLSEALKSGSLDGWEAKAAMRFVGICKRGEAPSSKQEAQARKLVDEAMYGPLVDA